MRNKKAEMGVGTLIIFVSMLIVAAIAAGVLITTVTGLQQKAVTTGQETTAEIASRMNVVQVTGTDGQDGQIESVLILVRLAAGSEPIAINDSLMKISASNDTGNLRFDPLGTASTSEFTVAYHVNGTEHRDNFLVRGDLVELNATLPREIGEDESVRISLIPKIGTQTVIDFRTPSVLSRQNVVLFP